MKSSISLNIIDDDKTILKVYKEALDNLGYPVSYFDNPLQFIEELDVERSSCILADIFMPGMTGFSLIKTLREKYKYYVPVIFMSARSSIDSVISALRLGALNFLQKPINEHALIEALHEGLRLASVQQQQLDQNKAYNMCYELLTPREQDVYHLLLDGKLTKVVAAELNISCSTAEIHRANVLQKMKVRNVMELLKKYKANGTLPLQHERTRNMFI